MGRREGERDTDGGEREREREREREESSPDLAGWEDKLNL